MALLLKSLKLLKEFRNIKPFSTDFIDGINVVVGENGSGKSSLLGLLTNNSFKEIVKFNYVPNTTFRFFDTEKENPRLKDLESMGKNYGFGLASHFASHGEAMLPILQAAKDFKDILLIVDEPEAGLSLSNQKKIFNVFESTIKKNCQVIVTTHSYVIIQSVPEVFNMDCLKWQSSKEYLKNVN